MPANDWTHTWDTPLDYTWAEFQRTFEIACTDAGEAKPIQDPTMVLPHSVFPHVTAMINPLTGHEVPITRISPFDWEQS
ncbi:hypothetical protein [Actinocrispum wychmicini]|uniref:Uncharacterized protein n=1 Tax=Actinocrispum wychmicini TaxID=1213861 RepID=A0A4R2JJH3_9PSEU|nr:hypothetical protein [Actinocrispum wychmicini]TCO57158.1 hypothetical protein EV192_106635 [Actinocrispum wychmicini]